MLEFNTLISETKQVKKPIRKVTEAINKKDNILDWLDDLMYVECFKQQLQKILPSQVEMEYLQNWSCFLPYHKLQQIAYDQNKVRFLSGHDGREEGRNL